MSTKRVTFGFVILYKYHESKQMIRIRCCVDRVKLTDVGVEVEIISKQ